MNIRQTNNEYPESQSQIRFDEADPNIATPSLNQIRLDAVRKIGQRAITPTGGLRLDAQITRSGIFEYRQPDGSISREWRPPAEVASAASLATLAAAAVTVGHKGLVSPTSWRTDTVGHVSEQSRLDGVWIHSPIYVQDAATVKAVEEGKLTGVSAGYRTDLIRTPGVTPEGERYDAIQINIRYNHVALIPPGTGRAGPEASIRLDGKDIDESFYNPGVRELPEGSHKVDFEKLYKESVARFDALTASNAVTTAERDATKAALIKVEAERDAARTELTTSRADSSDAAVDARVASRTALFEQARLVSKDIKCAGRSDHEIRLDCLKTLQPKADFTGKDAAYVTAYFDATLDNRGATSVAAARVGTSVSPARFDAVDEDPIADWNSNAWRGTSANPYKAGA